MDISSDSYLQLYLTFFLAQVLAYGVLCGITYGFMFKMKIHL